MATVKLTDKLKTEIQSKLTSMYSKRLQALREQIAEAKPDLDEMLSYYVQTTGSVELYEKTKHWFANRTHSYVTIQDSYDKSITESLSLYSTVAKPTPDSFNHYSMVVDKDTEVAYNSVGLATHTKLVKVLELRKTLNQLEGEKALVFDNVVRAIGAYPSVNAALKHHPELEHMLPEHTKQKLAEKVERAKAAVPEVTLDKDKLVSLAVMAKMGV